MLAAEHDLIVANESESSVLQKMEKILTNSSNKDVAPAIEHLPKLVSPDGSEIELPASVYQVLVKVVSYMLRGKAIHVIPLNKEVSTQEAAELLNVSRPYLVGLLEAGKIPFVKVGTHRRVPFTDLMAYRTLRYEEREKAIAEIARISQEEGHYD